MSREFVAIAIMGIDQHENGAVAIARVLREAQMKVAYFGKFQTPASVAERAIDEDADVVGISCHSWEICDPGARIDRRTAQPGLRYSRRHRRLCDHASGRRDDAPSRRGGCFRHFDGWRESYRTRARAERSTAKGAAAVRLA